MIAGHRSVMAKFGLLPSDYVELPFVNTNGDTVSGDAKKVDSAAAFSTGFTPTANTVVDTELCPGDNGTGEWETYMGGSSNGDAQTGAWLLRRFASGPNIVFIVNSWSGTGATVGFTNYISWIRFRISISSVDFNVDGVASTESVPNSSSFNGVAPIWIGAAGRHSTGDTFRGCKALFKRTLIYDNGVLVRDYVPAKRKSDSVCGFYELVNGEFKTSTVPNHVFTENGYQ